MTILSSKERRLLEGLQSNLPVVSRPFAYLGRTNQMEEGEVIACLKEWKNKGMIRWLGAIFSTHALGYQSTLAALSLPDDKVFEAADIINQHTGVTHNYQRKHEYNLWFTLAVPPEENIQAHLQNLVQASGAKKWISLSVVKTYKISLVLPLQKQIVGQKQPIAPTDHVYSVSEEEKALIRIMQENWPLVPRPYQALAEQWGRTEEELLEKVRQWKILGIIRRIAAILRHREAGFRVNWMVAWRIEKNKIDAAGERASQNPLVSHCYQRVLAADWPYPLFTMIHARSEEEAQNAVKELSQLIEPLDYKILPTVREFKKIRLKLFN